MSQNAASSMVVYAVEGFFLAKIPDVKENRGPQTPETPGKCRATKLNVRMRWYFEMNVYLLRTFYARCNRKSVE